MLLLDPQVGDLLEDIVESVVRMGNYDRPLLGEIVVEQVHYLNSHVSLASPRGTNYQRESFLKRTNDGVHLVFRKSNAIPLLHIPQFHLIIDEVLPVVLVRNLAEVLLQVGLVNKSIEQGGLITEFLLLILRTVPEDDFIQEGWQFGLNFDQIHY